MITKDKLFLIEQRYKEVFGNSETGNDWMKTKNLALGGKTPLELMESDQGIDVVLMVLGRIEHGIIS